MRKKRPKLSEVIKSYGMRGYNGLSIKDIYSVEDNTARPIQADIIIGMGNGARKYNVHKMQHNTKLCEVEVIELVPYYLQKTIPASTDLSWHGWVYGGEPTPTNDYDTAEWRKLRTTVLKRDKHKCQECGTNKCLTVHHVKPRQGGGKNEARNLITLCSKCHDLIEVGLSEALNENSDGQDE